MRSSTQSKLFGLLVSISIALFSQQALAKTVTLNLGYSTAEGSSYSIMAKKFEELAEKYSDNTINVKLRCCAQLSSEDEAFKSMQLGVVDMYIITSNNVSPHFPLMDAFILPYIFQNKAHAQAVLQGPIGKAFADKLAKDTGVNLLTYGFVGYRDFYNTEKPINSMSDLEGIKIRVPKNEVMLKTFKAFGAAPLPLSWADTPTALQTGTVEGADNGTAVIKSQKFYELASNLAVMEHFSYFSPLFASNRALKKLDDKQREAVLRAAKEAGIYQTKVMNEKVDDIRHYLSEHGMKLTYPDKTEFIKAAIGVQNEFAESKDDAFRKLLADIRGAATK